MFDIKIMNNTEIAKELRKIASEGFRDARHSNTATEDIELFTAAADIVERADKTACYQAAFIADLQHECNELRAKVDGLEKSAGFCKIHQPNGGARNCLVCASVDLSHAIHKIDYAMCEPNEYEVSQYSVDYDSDKVVERVSKLAGEVKESREALTTIMMNAQKYSGWWSYETARIALAKEGK